MSKLTLKNGLFLNYEKTGKGKAIVLIHGNGEDHTIFDLLVSYLAKEYCVYAVDSRGHGKSSQVSTLDFQSLMEDYVELIQRLKLDKPIVIGFSDGGIIGLMLAIQHPDLLGKLVTCGANAQVSGIKASCLFRLRWEYLKTHEPKVGMMLKQKAITDDELRQVKIPVYVLAGSADLIKESHTRHLASVLKVGKLMILEGEDHGSYVHSGDKLYGVVKDFIKN